MKKKILAISLAVSLVAIAALGVTLAYFTDTTSVDNVFTVGNVKITLTEPNWVSSGEVDAPDVYPGEALAKDPTVTNTGDNPCVVRLSVTMPDAEALAGMISIETNYVTDALGEGWKLADDGYYYYMKPLAVGAATSPLFDRVRFSTALEAIEGQPVDGYGILVQAQAVQAQGIYPSYSTISGGISDAQLPDIQAFFTTAFK